MAAKVPVFWAPQEGPQTLAAICPCDTIFYGGTRGGGKSDTAIGRQVHGALKYGPDWNGLVIRRKYKDLAEIIRRIDQLRGYGMPAERVGGDKETNYVKFANGARITLTAIQMLDQVDDWQGHQFTEISIDEAPTFSFIAQLIDRLKGSMRSPVGVPCHMFLTGNPGGAGASVIKAMFIDVAPPNTVVKHDDGTSSIFIKSTIFDNKILVKNDPKYVNRLLSINDPLLRAAWLEGRWDVFIGQAFDFTERHQIDPIWPIPEYAPLYMTFDWGYGAPFSIQWWWVDGDGRIFQFAEWYGRNEDRTDPVGLRLSDPDIASGILLREQKLGILGRKIVRISGPDCFSKKPNYLGGGQGPATAEEFAAYVKRPEVIEKYGPIDLTLIPGDADRKKKIRQFRNRLTIPKDADGVPTGEMPMMMVYTTCRNFIRTVPQLTLDSVDIEALEEHQESHCYDAACHICMARPIGMDTDEEYKAAKRKEKKATIAKLDSASRAAAQDFYLKQRRIAETGEYELGDDMAPTLYGLPDDDFDPSDIFG